MNIKPSVVLAGDENQLNDLYVGSDAEKATSVAKAARGSYAVIWKSINGRGWERWKGAVETVAAKSTPKKTYSRKLS